MKEKISGYYYLLGIILGFLTLLAAVFEILNNTNNLFKWHINQETIMLGATLVAVLFAGGEARRARLETGRSNRLSYLPGLVLYYKGNDLFIKNIGKRAALNPTLIEVELELEKEIGKPFHISGLLDVKEKNEEPIPINILSELGISKLRNGQSLCVKIKFDSPYDDKTSSDQLNHSTIQIIEGESKIIKFKKASWHADYRR
ncbi:MAG: hypothetical protein Q8P01_00560 [bacterium]|nr:hypothetical protein [bacterium]